MELTLQSLEICRYKTGSSQFCGFKTDQINMKDISQEDSSRAFDNLIENDLITLINEEIHVSALGQFFVKMMTDPEIMISVENQSTHKKVNIYIRDAYYLAVLNEKYEPISEGGDKLLVDLLPTLKEVVGAFIHGIAYEGDPKSAGTESTEIKDHSIHITGISWDKARKIDAQMDILGDYQGRTIDYHLHKKTDSLIIDESITDCQISSLVNTLTGWMFDRLSILEERREKHYGETIC